MEDNNLDMTFKVLSKNQSYYIYYGFTPSFNGLKCKETIQMFVFHNNEICFVPKSRSEHIKRKECEAYIKSKLESKADKMSVQGYRCKGFGYSFPVKECIFSFIKDKDEEYHFAEVIKKVRSYYRYAEMLEDSKQSELSIHYDWEGDDPKVYVLYVKNVSHIVDTHGTDYWNKSFLDMSDKPEFVKSEIECLLQRKLDTDPEQLEFEIYS